MKIGKLRLVRLMMVFMGLIFFVWVLVGSLVRMVVWLVKGERSFFSFLVRLDVLMVLILRMMRLLSLIEVLEWVRGWWRNWILLLMVWVVIMEKG